MEKSNIATTSKRHSEDGKLLVIQTESSRIKHHRIPDFVNQLHAGDVLVVNGAATLPASFTGIHSRSGQKIELRLAQNCDESAFDYSFWMGFVFGEGGWHLPTEERIFIPDLQRGDILSFSHDLEAQILELSPINQRFIKIKFLTDADQLIHQIYQSGHLIQYSYLEEELDLWDGQTIFSGRPLALEPPSATFPLTWESIQALENKGVQVVQLFHAAGISSTGEKELDNLLPLPEYYQIPEQTAKIVNQAKKNHHRIIALGTSVTRALESAVTTKGNAVQAGDGITNLIISPFHQRKIATGLFTGLHESGTSHLKLLQSFVPLKIINKAYEEAKRQGYLWHEFGDSCLII